MPLVNDGDNDVISWESKSSSNLSDEDPKEVVFISFQEEVQRDQNIEVEGVI